MTEKEFIESIDCRFPYQNEFQWKQMIELGNEISPNAAFAVLHEICRPPRNSSVEPTKLLSILDVWATRFKHPLASSLVPIANTMIRQEFVSIPKALKAMQLVAQYPNQYYALSVVYFSCDDVNGEIESLFDQITHDWEQLKSRQT